MAKASKTTKPRDAAVKPAGAKAAASSAPAPQTHAVRETVESIVIAFVLAFLFRTFEAEAFVIPTGSMAPTLMGRHKDVDCPKCGYRYQVSASEENRDENSGPVSDCLAGMCPICHYVMPMRPNLPAGMIELERPDKIPLQRSYNGDRILVNKYVYTFGDPERWDVVVFKFPGNAQMNYIKRLVGLPGETLRIFQGDLFVGGEGASQEADFKIERKPAEKALAMRQLVHDTNYDPAELDAAGWPLRWRTDGWQLEKTTQGENVRQRYSVDSSGDNESWIRYENWAPNYRDWLRLEELEQQADSASAKFTDADRSQWRKRLIMDANPYNGREDRIRISGRGDLDVAPLRQGIHWVGDLMVEADVEVEAAQGSLLLDLVEGGRHFTCTIDLTNGEATLAAPGAKEFAPTALTPIKGAGKYHVAFANVDDQLLLWVDGDLISFPGGTEYDAEQVFGSRREIRPQTSETDPGDLAPVGIGARGAKLAVTRLQVWRDIYYIADNWEGNRGDVVTDFPHPFDQRLLDLAYDPTLWHWFDERRSVKFPLGEDQFFVMGDNSAESSDARLWLGPNVGRPGGEYLERRLLIGKALCVYWPHSWNRIPGTPIPFPLFPNFGDMRLVR